MTEKNIIVNYKSLTVLRYRFFLVNKHLMKFGRFRELIVIQKLRLIIYYEIGILNDFFHTGHLPLNLLHHIAIIKGPYK